MPIYAYRCEACGHAKDVLQKISDAPLTTCPSCGADAFRKQVTAAGFQLKGTGWYVTDFRGGGSNSATATGSKAGDAKGDAAKPEGTAASGEKGGDSASTSSSAPAPAPASGTSGGSGSSSSS